MAVGPGIEQDSSGRRPRKARAGANGDSPSPNGVGEGEIAEAELRQLLSALRAARDGDFRVRLPANRAGIAGELAQAFNELAERREAFSKEIARVGTAIGRDGRLTERAKAPASSGHWAATTDALNTLIDHLVRPTTEVAR
ncbi:MAG TPA: hypothetical protein VFI01_04355, partial [Gaiellaceae bacterium]|nr:hypothetical protein [Gaiellaceae bacterium]